ncbi:hypothetical protein ALC56_04755, partial [Trachymyrmex septentrionalis]
ARAGRSKEPTSFFYAVLPRGGYLSHRRKRVYNRQALILIVPLSPPRPFPEGASHRLKGAVSRRQNPEDS